MRVGKQIHTMAAVSTSYFKCIAKIIDLTDAVRSAPIRVFCRAALLFHVLNGSWLLDSGFTFFLI